ncbi:MAG: HlyD family efflux transporter periplasmic adaptor subunit [Blautia sp.]|nr:HlyD family efflux transporter periplasmic adaptor subunit [Blautia sp.]
MSKGVKIVVGVLILGALGAGGAYFYQNKQRNTPQQEENYQKEIVRRGTVSTGILESGTIEFGTQEQTFEVAKISEVDTTTSTETSGTMGSGTSGGGSMQGNQGGGMGADMMGSFASGGGDASGGSNANSGSGTATSLEVEEVYVAPGEVLQAGDKLLKITEDSIQEYRTQLEAAVASAELLVSKEEINVEIKRAEADYTYQVYLAEGKTAEETYQATITSLEEKITDLEEEIAEEDDEDELEALQAELKLAQNNLTTGSIEAKQTYDNAMTNFKYADQLYAIDTDGLEDDLNSAKDTLEECEENLKAFEEQIGDGIVYSQYTGTVASVSYSAGDSIENEAVLMTCTDPEDVLMTVSVSQEDIAAVSIGNQASITLTAYKDERFDAEITEISTTSKTGSSTVNYDVTLKLTGDISKVYSGMTGEVLIAGKEVEDTLYISNKAVRLSGTKSVVKILEDDGTIHEQEITTGFSDGKTVAVESGLEEGQIVILESQVTQ